MSGLGENNPYPERKNWIANEHGFDGHYRQVLEEHHRALQQEYGDIMAPVRYIKNPDHSELFLLAQEHLDVADSAAVMEHYPVDIESDFVKEQFVHFVSTLKENIQLRNVVSQQLCQICFPATLFLHTILKKLRTLIRD